MSGFSQAHYELDRCNLRRLSGEEVADIAAQLVQIDPWKTLKTDQKRLVQRFKVIPDKGGAWGIFFQDLLVGLVSINPNWLAGPYLEFLGIIPEAQGEKLGVSILSWMEDEATISKARNLFLCVSGFNHDAQRFYQRFGFAHVGTMEGLIDDEHSEILMRKRLS